MPLDPERLAVRADLTDLVVGYARALDARDWPAFRALFEDQIDIDYASLGSIRDRLSADAWTERCRVLGGFDATHHKVANFSFAIERDVAEVTSAVDAAHFIGPLAGFVLGTYVHRCRRHGEAWKIAGCTLTVAGYPHGRAAFDAAFDAARAAFATQDASA